MKNRMFILKRSGPCWMWPYAVNVDGYGLIGNNRAHRWMYERLVEPIPDGLEIDHLCGTRACVNPAHLEPVTHLENVRRGKNYAKTHCKRGHEFTPFNTKKTFQNGRPGRACRTCIRWYYKRDVEKRKAVNKEEVAQ